MIDPHSLTNDTFFNGRISVKQPSAGYRFSIDAVILGNLAVVAAGQRVLDIGTGCGVIPLIVCFRHPEVGLVFGAEIQPELAQIAALNISENQMTGKIRILCKDVKVLCPSDTGGAVDVVVCNPPHFAVNAGRLNPDSQRAVARHEIAMTLADMTGAAARMLGPSGRFTVIYPSERIVDLLAAMRAVCLEPKQVRMIHPRPGDPAKRVLVHGIKGKAPGTSIAHPLYIRTGPERYSDEILAMLRP